MTIEITVISDIFYGRGRHPKSALSQHVSGEIKVVRRGVQIILKEII